MTPDVAGDAAIQDEVLEGLSSAVRYRRWICELAEPYLGPAPLEVGSGNGDYAAEWASMGRAITASEAVPARVAGLRGRFRDEPMVDVRALTLPTDHQADHSAVVAINVLEHVEDDVAALAGMRSLVRDGGHVVVFVPAFPVAMSAFDREVGHYRRYRRKELVEKLRLAGLDPRRAHYVNAPGLIAWILLMRIAGRRPGEGLPCGGSRRSSPSSGGSSVAGLRPSGSRCSWSGGGCDHPGAGHGRRAPTDAELGDTSDRRQDSGSGGAAAWPT